MSNEDKNKVWVVMSAGSMSMRVDGVHLSEQSVVDYYREAYGIDDIDDYEEMVEYLTEDGDMEIDTSYIVNNK